MTDPTPNDWTPWNGGDCPVPGETRVKVLLRSGQVLHDWKASRLVWNHGPDKDDILLYHVVQEAPVSQALYADDAPVPLLSDNELCCILSSMSGAIGWLEAHADDEEKFPDCEQSRHRHYARQLQTSADKLRAARFGEQS
jgi:hypothetical protein